jgi:hypothetical protein
MGRVATTAAEMAEELGVSLGECPDAPFRFAVALDSVVCASHPDPVVMEARAWEGLAGCLLERAGVPWTENAAMSLAARMKLGDLKIH